MDTPFSRCPPDRGRSGAPRPAAPPRGASAVCGGLLPLALAIALGAGATTPAPAMVITSEVGVNTAVEFNATGGVLREDHADTTSGGPANASVQLGNGTNAFDQPTFAQAFSAFRGTQATYWVNLNADNTVPGSRGIGAAGVQLTYSAIKEAGDTAFTLHTTGGRLQLADPGAGSTPLSALVGLDAFVLSGQDVLSHVSARAELFGNGGTFLTQTFRLRSEGFDIRSGDFRLDDDFPGNNVFGATLDLRPLNIPVDLSRIVDGTPITIAVTLNGEVRGPGAETIASAFFRDPAFVNASDPFAGASFITFDTGPTGPVTGVPEPSALALLGSALLAGWAFGRRRRRPVVA